MSAAREHRSRSRGRQTRAAGFTLIEIMTVLLILGVILMSVVPAIDGLVPSYRLRGAAREVAALLEMAQSEAIATRKEFKVAYDLSSNTYWLILPPAPPEGSEDGEPTDPALDPAQTTKEGRPLDDVEHGLAPVDPDAEQDEGAAANDHQLEALAPKGLPTDVVFAAIIVGDDEKSGGGEVMVPFEHLGTGGSHVVGLKLENGDDTAQIWVKFNALTRTIEYHDEKPSVRTLSGSDR